MGSTFSGLEIGKKGLWAQKKSLEVTSHNIANANNDSYSRQEAIQTATNPLSVSGAGQMGTGVEVSEVRRVRSDFVDEQVRKEKRTKGYWEVKEESLKEMELIFNEPSDQGVQQTMSDFWNAMEDLNNKPESKAVRATVRQRALAVTDTFNHIDEQLNDYKLSVDSRVQTTVQDINSHAKRIADLNKQIVRVESDNQDANDLRDKRTQLVGKLSELTNIQVSENEVGSMRISISGRGLVQGENVTELEVKSNPSNDDLYKVQWSDGNDVTLKDGKLEGLLEVRDKDISKYRSQLDEMAKTLIDEVNAQHQQGYGLTDNVQRDFFTGSDAGSIDLIDELKEDAGIQKIAAASQWADSNGDGTNDYAGDGSNASALSGLRNAGTMNSGTTTFSDYYASNIAQLGVESQRAQRMIDNQDTLITSLEQKQESISGVSLDEEMNNMIKYQHAYNAAAKVVSTMDEILGTVINGLKR
ncbi:flagellar hook-associated protein FlgK [Halanaerobacter jeridensis]|uniref:Flagellar hook-associated protein 1 n=1 Tax=Halanaerobacter jeridensis TaxID=706427 RepID=A0A938XTC8_9FIRM|nr:flagellar hook-associated protein FlgK [Halanaerobacter jeridensis]MBM7557474.1 flagellar hook-associated protein 1 FlgK [Halanaerobacter jeridensis]